MDYLTHEKIEFMTHCPYSSSFLPNDLFLFPFIKNKMCGQYFNNSEEAVEAYKCHVSTMPFSEQHTCFDWLFECKNASMLQESILWSNKRYILGNRLFFVLLSKNLILPLVCC